MTARSIRISLAGIVAGGMALILALVHFWAGPFAPQRSLERTVAETAVAIRDATVAAMRGKEIEERAPVRKMNIDKILRLITNVLGGFAVILGVAAAALGEPMRAAVGAVFLGGGAIAFQFAALALGLLFLAILIASVLSHLDW